MPSGELPPSPALIDKTLVRNLLAEQHPDLVELPIVHVKTGYENEIFRLGDEFTVRLPRRSFAAIGTRAEHRWLPTLAPNLPLPVPVPLRIGEPGAGYPWPWTIHAWLPGVVAFDADLAHPDEAAQVIGRFLAALHTRAPQDAPINPLRGIPLSQRDDEVRARVAKLADLIDAPGILGCWRELVAAPPWTGPPVWLHGDLHPGNVLVEHGRISAVIDFGDLTSGDPADDLAVAWMLLPPHARAVLREAAGTVDDDTWIRARGWALAHGLSFLMFVANRDLFARLGRRVLTAALAEQG